MVALKALVRDSQHLVRVCSAGLCFYDADDKGEDCKDDQNPAPAAELIFSSVFFHFHPSRNSLPNQHSDSRCDKPDSRAEENRPQDQMFRKAKLHEFVLRLIKRIVFRAVRM